MLHPAATGTAPSPRVGGGAVVVRLAAPGMCSTHDGPHHAVQAGTWRKSHHATEGESARSEESTTEARRHSHGEQPRLDERAGQYTGATVQAVSGRYGRGRRARDGTSPSSAARAGVVAASHL